MVKMWMRRAVMLTAVLWVWGGGARQAGYAQLQGVIPPASQGRSGQTKNEPGDDSQMTRDAAAKQERARNDDRQKRLVADTDKLLALATQLHEDVSKTNKDVLSIDVIKRAQEIEKLAHDVKERMKG